MLFTPTLIRELRRKLGWSQSRLARQIKVDPSAISHWERGTRHPLYQQHVALENTVKRYHVDL